MNGSKNVTIPAEVADAIEYLRKEGSVWDDAIIANCFNGAYSTSSCPTRSLLARYADGNTTKTVSAIINGYEREMTAEQRAHERISEAYHRRIEDGHSRRIAFADGIKFTLNELGVKIEGVTV
jgi:hypothetical protein